MSVPWNDDRIVCRIGKVFFGGPDRAIDASTRRVVDEGIYPVPEGVGGVQDVRLFEVHRDVAVGMRWTIIFQSQRYTVDREGPLIREDVARQGRRGERLEVIAPILDTLQGQEVLARIFVCQDLGAELVQPLVAVRVVEMP